MRKRFTPQERADFTPGTRVEWRNGRHWHPGTVVGPLVTDDGWQSIYVVNHVTTRTVKAGARIDADPTSIRLPESGQS